MKTKIVINKNEISFDDFSMSFNVIKEKFPEDLKLIGIKDPEVAYLYYESASTKNKVKYKNGIEQPLPFDSMDADEFYAKRYIFKFEHNEVITKERLANLVEYKVEFYDIFCADFSRRNDLLKEYCTERSACPLPTDNQFNSFLKNFRSSSLVASDWTQLPDVQASMSEEEKQEWLDYRAKLRVITDSNDPLNEVILPMSPKTKNKLIAEGKL